MSVSPQRREQARRALLLNDEALWRECRVEYFVAQGPGGQHRNTTHSGVRLSHPSTELSVTATERRSQFQNRQRALERLREGLMLLTFVPKTRRPTRPTKGAQKRRLSAKKLHSEKKANRQNKEG